MVAVWAIEVDNSRELREQKKGLRVGGRRGSRHILINTAPLTALSLRLHHLKGWGAGNTTPPPKTCSFWKVHRAASALIMKRGFCFQKISSLHSLPQTAGAWQEHGLVISSLRGWTPVHRNGLHPDDRQSQLIFCRLCTWNHAPCFLEFINSTADGSPT